MKDHLKLNTSLLSKSLVDAQETHKKTDMLKDSEGSGKPGIVDSLTGSEDRFDGRLNRYGDFNDSIIDEMDLNAALELTAFVRQQAANPEGRRLMSSAHHAISPKQVAGLFATA
jgi:hypothetical protein